MNDTQPKENRRVKMTRQLLRNSLIELLQEKPIGKITIKELCHNADVNRSTFYLYYPDQYALFAEFENDLLEHARAHLARIDTNPVSVHYIQELLAYIRTNAEGFKALLCRKEGLPFQSVFVAAALDMLKRSLPLACKAAVAAYAYDFLIMGSLSIIQRWVEADCDRPCEELAGLIFRLSDGARSVFS